MDAYPLATISAVRPQTLRRGDYLLTSAQRSHVVGPAKQRGYIGLHREGRLKLLIPHLSRGQSSDGEIGIVQSATLCRVDAFREPLRPTPVSTVAIRIVDALGQAVTEGNITLK